MNVIRAGVLGFCEGVRRAVEMAWRAHEQSKPGQAGVYTLGPLIHNSRVLKSLEDRGIRILEDGYDLFNELKPVPKNSTVIIRTHGVSPLAEAELRQPGLRILDATCPHVKVSQRKAQSFAERGYAIFLAGEKGHGEIAGIRGYVEEAYVVANPVEAEATAAELSRQDSGAKTVLIGQTTISPEEYSLIGDAIKRHFPSLEILNTICNATAERQKALRELCGKVDALLIVGDRESSNTRRLLSLALELGKPAWLVESPEDIPPEIKAYETVGLSAGASAPDDLINVIEETLNDWLGAGDTR